MHPDLRLCVSQLPNDTPYQFKVTGLHVYSFEEALYHVYHYWKQSVDDFLSDEFIAWVNDALSLSFLAARMKDLARADSFSVRMSSFLRLTDYFDEGELLSLQNELLKWEKRLEWEKLKERADYLMNRGEPDKAAILYRRALQYEENIALYNNLAMAYMQSEAYTEAYQCLKRALAIQPDNAALTMRLAEAAIYGRRFDDAHIWIAKAEALAPGNPDIPFLRGALCCEQGDYTQTIAYYETAVARSGGSRFYLHRLADVYAAMRQYDQALEVLSRAGTNTADLVKQAELYAAAGNMPAAVKAIQKALTRPGNETASGTGRSDSELQAHTADLWTRLAMYHRLDYDLNSANNAIVKALSVDPENERAKLENARIKKGMGRTREYQSVLNAVLRGFRQKYREVIS